MSINLIRFLNFRNKTYRIVFAEIGFLYISFGLIRRENNGKKETSR